MEPNKNRMLKPRGVGYRLRKAAKKFTRGVQNGVNTQILRNDVLLDLQTMFEYAFRRSNDKRIDLRERRVWSAQAAYVAQTISCVAKEYDAAKIQVILKELVEKVEKLEQRSRKKG